LTEKAFDTRGPLEKFEGINFYDSQGNVSSEAVNCSNSILNKKPCFPELVWDNLQSTSPVRALPIVDDIGQILGVLMNKKGTNVNAEASVKAQFTCNDPEGSGAKFKPNIVNGKVDSIEVINPGIGYGFDPASTYCPNEQYGVLVNKLGLQEHLSDGEFVEHVVLGNPDILQVVDTDYDPDHILLATIDPSFNPQLEVGMNLKTKSGHEFVLNFDGKFPTLVIPQGATAIYAKCGDIIPKVDKLSVRNVGRNYVNPVITIGTGTKKRQIGTATKDAQGRLVELDLTESVLGFVKPVVEDLGFEANDIEGTGTGAEVSVVYEYTSPRELRENNVLPLTQYVDCVGHPMIKSAKEEEDDGLADRGFNLIDSQLEETTTDSDTTTVSTPTVADPVSTPVTPDTGTQQQQTQQTQQQNNQQQQQQQNNQQQQQQNNNQQQGGYGGY